MYKQDRSLSNPRTVDRREQVKTVGMYSGAAIGGGLALTGLTKRFSDNRFNKRVAAVKSEFAEPLANYNAAKTNFDDSKALGKMKGLKGDTKVDVGRRVKEISNNSLDQFGSNDYKKILGAETLASKPYLNGMNQKINKLKKSRKFWGKAKFVAGAGAGAYALKSGIDWWKNRGKQNNYGGAM